VHPLLRAEAQPVASPASVVLTDAWE